MEIFEGTRIAARMYAIRRAGNQEYAIRQAAEGNQDALAYILRGFVEDDKRGRAPDPEAVHVVADVLERDLAGENIRKILGTQAKRGRPPEYNNAILVHAMVRYLMLLRSQRRGDDAKATVAEALGIPLDTVRENYKRVSQLIKTIKDNPFLDLKRRGLGPKEDLYVRDPEKPFFLLIVVKQRLLEEGLYLSDPENAFSQLNVVKQPPELKKLLELRWKAFLSPGRDRGK